MKTLIKVPVIESERGWGAKIDDHMVCLDPTTAKQFINEFNSKNNKTEVPDWYMYAADELIPYEVSDEVYTKVAESENKMMWLASLRNI